LVQDVALAVQGALLAQSAPPAVCAAFCNSRLGGDWGQTYGSLGSGAAFQAILDRALPH
ncbi:MAG: DNA alkylation response protein, partial [Curvibacter sp.]